MKLRYMTALGLVIVGAYVYTQQYSGQIGQQNQYSGTIGGNQDGGTHAGYGQQGGQQYSGQTGAGGCPVCPVCPQQPQRYVSKEVTDGPRDSFGDYTQQNKQNFFEALHRQDKAAVKAWLDKGMDINTIYTDANANKMTPLQFAEKNSLWEIGAYLRTQGAA